MPMVAHPFREMPELRKMEHRLVAVCAKNKMATFGSRGNRTRIVAKSANSGEPVFTSMDDVLLYGL
jgi:hypothetical protein